MGVPATTGQLRTKVSEMEIGDYIAMRFAFSSGSACTNFLLANPGTELPLTGAAAESGGKYAYLIKAAKGLLISDRVVQHTLTWDNMNTSKVIQGLPWDSGNIIPTMTSNTSPSGVASASSEVSTKEAFKAFDKSVVASNSWSTYITPTGWLAYEFSTPKTVKKYTVQVENTATYLGRGPKDWTFEGWNGSEWIILDQQMNITTWSVANKKSFLFANKTAYIKYRINITANNGDTSNYLAIQELEMYDTVGTIRSLTGGVAYSDANGNMSLTQPKPSKGAWPTNNEFDKYLLGFPLDKIQSDKTLDDVFHHDGNYTLCQDTPIAGTWKDSVGSLSTSASSSSRIGRGSISRNQWMDINYVASSFTSTTWGFRPVFEYQES